jgi:protein gp37
MAEKTGIAWTDSTFNPRVGCSKVGPGCDNCYAEALMDKRWHRVQWGPGQPRQKTSAGNWKQPVLWEREHAAFELMHGRRRRVFCASLADVFDNEVPAAWRADLFEMIRKTPNLDWLLLTKRIGNVQKMLEELGLQQDGLPANVWLGATVVNQEEYDRDAHKLLRIQASVRFLSMEPMLGPVRATPSIGAFDWVIVGGESGAGARPLQRAWVESMHDQCNWYGVPFFFKQWGGQTATAGGCALGGSEVKEWPVAA